MNNKLLAFAYELSETVNSKYNQIIDNFMPIRMYQDIVGMDMSWLYDVDNIMDIKKKQAQEEWLDNTPLAEIADLIDSKILDIRLKFIDDSSDNSYQAGDGVLELLNSLK